MGDGLELLALQVYVFKHKLFTLASIDSNFVLRRPVVVLLEFSEMLEEL